MKIHYQLNDIDNALNKLPIEKGSTVFLHSNILALLFEYHGY